MVHKFKSGNLFLALDVFSGGVHVLDELSYELLDFAGENMGQICPESAYKALFKYDKSEIDECYAELYSLYDNKMLFTIDDTYEKIAAAMGAAPVKSMCLNVAHDCNLRCEYCFAAKGDFGQGRMLMPLEVGKKAIDFMIEHSTGRKNLELDFFGGEPLMNFDVVKGVVEYARSIENEHGKNFRFTITTNGLLLNDEIIDYINKEMFNVVLSIDGRPEVNDRMRVFQNGKGCYDMIIPKFKNLVAKRGDKNYYVRGTFTKENLDFTNDVLHLYKSGFDQISVEPVVCDETLPYALNFDDIPVVLNEYDKLANEIVKIKKSGKHINFFHFMLDLEAGPCAIKRLRGCSAGNEYIAITPEGDIYPCHQFVGVNEFKMGNLNDGTFDNDMKKDFSQINVYKKEDCKNCFAKFFCSGGCTANNYFYANGVYNVHKTSCEFQRKRLECSIAIQAALA
ncbi:MAG: thioether cross-link-forming SCIFF peptide maturase, partial [Oscillospiraceae bacterium]